MAQSSDFQCCRSYIYDNTYSLRMVYFPSTVSDSTMPGHQGYPRIYDHTISFVRNDGWIDTTLIFDARVCANFCYVLFFLTFTLLFSCIFLVVIFYGGHKRWYPFFTFDFLRKSSLQNFRKCTWINSKLFY